MTDKQLAEQNFTQWKIRRMRRMLDTPHQNVTDFADKSALREWSTREPLTDFINGWLIGAMALGTVILCFAAYGFVRLIWG